MLRLIFVINLESNFSNICVWHDQFWGELNWDLTAEFFRRIEIPQLLQHSRSICRGCSLVIGIASLGQLYSARGF